MNIPFEQLVDWYNQQCDGLWEHEHYGFTIGTLDNPALRLKVDLNGTYLQEKDFVTIEQNYSSDTEWLICEKKEGFFHGCSPPHLFGEVIGNFLEWANKNG